jgi:hypothetical protein
VALIIAKGFVPPANVPGDILFEAMHVAPFPGNPASENYDDSLPDFHWPLIFAVGNVSAPATEQPQHQVVFPLAISEFVRGSPQQSTIQYVAPLPCDFEVLAHNCTGVCSTKVLRGGTMYLFPTREHNLASLRYALK